MGYCFFVEKFHGAYNLKTGSAFLFSLSVDVIVGEKRHSGAATL
jgi:hypothetical protein